MRVETYELPGPYLFRSMKTTYVISCKQAGTDLPTILQMLLERPPTPQLTVMYLMDADEGVQYAHRQIVQLERETHASVLVLDETSRYTGYMTAENVTRVEAMLTGVGYRGAKPTPVAMIALGAVPLVSIPLAMGGTVEHLAVWRGLGMHALVLTRSARRHIADMSRKERSDVAYGYELYKSLRTITPLKPLVATASVETTPAAEVSMLDTVIQCLLWARTGDEMYCRLHMLGACGGLGTVAVAFVWGVLVVAAASACAG